MSTSPAPETEHKPTPVPRPEAVFRQDGSRVLPEEKITIERVDFRNPTFLAEGEQRRLRSMHEDCLRVLASRLSTLLRAELVLNLSRFGTQSCESFIEGLKNPTQITLFRVSSLTGVGFIEIPPKLAIALTNRILGGREPSVTADAYLTEIETALLEDVLNIMTAEWCEQWHDNTPMNATLIGHETNPRFIQSAAKNSMMLVVGVAVAFGRCDEIMQIAVPLSMIEPMMKRQQANRNRDSGIQRTEKSAAWRPGYDEIAIDVHADMVAARMTVEALLALKEGDVIELEPTVLETAKVHVAGAVRFTGRAGQKNGFVAVQITDNSPAKK